MIKIGYWNVGLYDNDYSHDILSKIENLLQEDISISSILIKLNKTTELADERMVLADLELFAYGRLIIMNNIMIDVDNEIANPWTTDDKKVLDNRLKILKEFKSKIIESEEIKPLIKSKKEVIDWLKDKRSQDIFGKNTNRSK